MLSHSVSNKFGRLHRKELQHDGGGALDAQLGVERSNVN